MKIVLLGSGNVATQMGKAFSLHGHQVLQVYSKTKANADALASVFGAPSIADLKDLALDADLYLLAVSDSAIASLAAAMPMPQHGIVCHCSGATDLAVLNRFAKQAVIYPPQSLSKNVETHLQDIPFALEANSPEVLHSLFGFMQELAPKSFASNSAQRLALHVAAVFANNFSNLLFQISEDILNAHNLPFELLRPIILETAQKVQSHSPAEVQTGPASRGDQQTLNTHLNFLSKNSHWVKIYQQLSEEIRIKSDSD